MEQPKVYNTEEELIKWFIYDLEEQRKEIAKNKNIDIKEVEYKELVLNFGSNKITINENQKLLQGGNFTKYANYLIRFNLILEEILKYFNIKERYVYEENGFPYLICHFKVNISHCSFETTDIRFYRTIFEETVSFVNTTFSNEVDFFALKFIKSVYFNRVNFNCGKDIRFSNIIFKNKIDFSDLQWKNKLLFYDINSSLEFNLSALNIIDTLEIRGFNENIENNLTSIINLDNISFENSKSLLSIKYVTNTIESVSLKDIYMNGRINFYNIKIKNINLRGTNIIGDFSDINCEYDNLSNWQTARILKHEEYKKSNSIKALEYHAEETKLYKEYLSEEIKKKFNIKKFGDILSISLSSLYSDNGLNWIKSIIVTIMLTAGIFSIYYSILKNTCHFIIMILVFLIFIRNIKKCVSIYIYIIIFIFSLIFIDISVYYVYISILNKNIQNINFIYEYYEYLNPTNYKELKYLKEVNFIKQIFAGLLYFLGKIAFWYGSVQTVQSFRKFSKKE